MTRWALIDGGKVANVVEQDTKPGIAGVWIPALGAGPGWLYDGAVLSPPPVPPEDRRITRLAFLTRFTDAEAIAIDLSSMGSTVQAASMRRYMQKVNAATFIDLGRPDTRGGVQALEAGGVLAAGRALQILDGPIQDGERPQ